MENKKSTIPRSCSPDYNRKDCKDCICASCYNQEFCGRCETCENQSRRLTECWEHEDAFTY